MLPAVTATFTGPLDAAGDITCVVETATIIHGRDDPTSQPEADTTTFEIWGPIPDGIDIGSALHIDATLGAPPAAAAADAPAPLTDPTLTLGPVTMTFLSRPSPEFMIFRLTCTADNYGYMYPRVEVQFSTAPDGSAGPTANDQPACAAGSSFEQVFNDLNWSGTGQLSRAFRLRYQSSTGEVTAWVEIPITETVTYPRFTGRVTDIELTWADTADHPVCRVTAAGDLAGMGHTLIGETSMPAEMDGERANFVIVDAGMPTDAARSDSPGTIHVIARPADRQPALQIAQEAAEDGGGVLWQSKDGKVLYADAVHRDGAVLTLALDCHTIPLDITWVKNLEGMCNDATITYYESGTAYEQHVWDEDSIARHGLYAASLGTRIAGEGDAITRGARLIFAQAEPSWRVAGVGLHLELLSKVLEPSDDHAMTGAILALDMHDLVSVVGMPYGSPINPAYLFIEGWTETITFDQWHLELAVSDYCQTGAEETWDEVNTATTWDTGYEGDPTVTWDTLPCAPPPGA